MGLLDDAIREHLDLKRRRGADPTEVERSEREALGPVRRATEEPEDAEFGEAQDEDRGFAYDQEDDDPGQAAELFEDEPLASESDFESVRPTSRPALEPNVSDELVAAPEPSVSDEPFAAPEPSGSDERPAAPERSARLSRDLDEPPVSTETPTSTDLREADPDVPQPYPAPTPRPRRDSGQAGGETVEYDVEDALEEQDAEPGEDVLEETPEFLQDTPEHDRLWFEQRPPRDFDFDG